MSPWFALEPVASRVARCVPGYHLREGDAWALAWFHVTAIVPDATVRELRPWIGIIGEPRWLETLVVAVAKARGVDPVPWVNTAARTAVYEAP